MNPALSLRALSKPVRQTICNGPTGTTAREIPNPVAGSTTIALSTLRGTMAARVVTHGRSLRSLTSGKKKAPSYGGQSFLVQGSGLMYLQGVNQEKYGISITWKQSNTILYLPVWLRVEPLQIDPSHGAGAQESQISDNDL